MLLPKYELLSKHDFAYNCETCPTRCDGKSKLHYNFKKDVDFSEYYENAIIQKINQSGTHLAQKTNKKGYPDIEIFANDYPTACLGYIEVKVQRRTFMSVGKYLPKSKLIPSETLALNLSDLQRYFVIQQDEKKPVLLLWVLLNRPCILGEQEYEAFYQNAEKLLTIYQEVGNNRRFRRKSGKGDIVNGQHKGVVVNYHFSLAELVKGFPDMSIF